jgi:hypothetical protein
VSEQERERLKVRDGTADEVGKAKVESLRRVDDFPFFTKKIRGYLDRLREYKAERELCVVIVVLRTT